MSNTEFRELLATALDEIERLRKQRDELLEGRNEPIAVIGMACRFPGASNPDELWSVAHKAVDCIGRVPIDRWNAEAYFDPSLHASGKVVTMEGGFLPDVRGFDAAFFGISPREARSVDPQHRLLLEVTWEAIERAAIASNSLYGTDVGVYLGLSNLEYQNLIRDMGDPTLIDSYFGTGNAASIAAGRIAYTFGFKGPAMTIDTACSSSLVAIHQAIASLRREECGLAISGGINLMLTPETFIHFSNARMLAPDGRCKPFSSQANGYGRGEGCGVVVLKLLRNAIAHGDPIDAIILGSACNHDGRSAGLTAPNGPSQEAVISSALKDAKLQPGDIQFVEAHGTGTPLGDPIEAGALARVYGAGRASTKPLFVSTIKANIGHTEGAAGVAGLIHACMCLKHRQIPRLLHFKERSSHIEQPSLHFTITGEDLRSNAYPLRAGVSSFGFSGTNSHVILQQAPVFVTSAEYHHQDNVSSPSELMFVLSAKTEIALRHQAIRFQLWLESNSGLNLADICCTLQTGRNHFEHRMAFCASDVLDAVECLKKYLAGEPLEATRIPSLARQFISGATVDWPVTRSRRITLPTYAFQHEPFWVQGCEIENANSKPLTVPRLPANFTCSLDPGAWQSLSDHRLFGASVMPAVTWLDIAHRAASSHFGGNFYLTNVRFNRMMVVGGESSPVFTTRFFDSPTENSFGIFVPSNGATEFDIDDAFINGQVINAAPNEWRGGVLEANKAHCCDDLDLSAIYNQLTSIGFDYGPEFRKLSRLSVCEKFAIGQLQTDSESTEKALLSQYGLFDSAMHVVAGAAWQYGYAANDATAFFPVGIQSVKMWDDCGLPTWSMAVLRPSTDDYAIEADVFVWNNRELPMIQLIGVKFDGLAIQKQTTNLRPTVTSSKTSDSNDPLTAAKLLAMPDAERITVLQNHLREQLARELDMPTASLLLDQPLSEYGLDSLIVFRMGIQLESEFGFSLNSLAMIQGQSLGALSESLLWRLNHLTSDEKKGTQSSVST